MRDVCSERKIARRVVNPRDVGRCLPGSFFFFFSFFSLLAFPLHFPYSHPSFAMSFSISSFDTEPKLHPLDIYDLLELIATHLDKPDLASACRVRKSWFQPFASVLWRSIPSRPFYTKGFAKSCLKYKRFIRELSCPKTDLLLDPSFQLTRLTALSVPLIRSDGSLFPIFGTYKDTLRSLSIGRIQCLDSKIAFDSLCMLKNLRCLDLTGPRLPLLYIKGILCQLPVLQDLRLHEGGTFSLDEVALDSGFETLPEILTLSTKSDDHTTLDFGLKRLEIKSHYGAFHPLLSIATSSPILENFVFKGDYDTRDPSLVVATVQELAKTLRQSCSRLKELILESWWVGPTESDYVLQLRGTLAGAVAPPHPIDYSSGSLLSPWTGLRSLHVYGQAGGHEGTPERNRVLFAIWEDRQTLQEILEEVVVPGNSFADYYAEETVVAILCHFKNLRVFDIGRAFLPIQYLFKQSFVSKGDTSEDIERDLQPWACKDLEVLYLALSYEEEGLGWCPDEWNLHEAEMCDIAGLTARFGETYPLFIAIKHFLGQFPKLDQKPILFNMS